MPFGTKGIDPVAIMIFLAVISLSGNPTFLYLTFCFPYTHENQKKVKLQFIATAQITYVRQGLD
jgi:hypothetical protein